VTWLSFGARTYHEGSLRVDIRPVADVQADVLRLPFADGVFEGVEFYHVLGHLWPWTAEQALGELARVTRSGCPIEVAVPDLLRCAALLLHGKPEALNLIYSPSREAAQCHRFGYTPSSLARLLARRLRHVRFLDRSPTDPHEVRMAGDAP
jgi:SAM-dependent methyltransferase